MAANTRIEWTEDTWNPVTGCTLVSEGCRNCYAARETAGRLAHLPRYEGLAVERGGRAVFTGEVRLHEDRVDLPLRWRKPRLVFVNSMSDLFHENVPDAFIARVFGVMARARKHTFQILTKRPERMSRLLGTPSFIEAVRAELLRDAANEHLEAFNGWWPLANVWLGTSVEDQATANERVPHLLDTPAGVRFLSCEPLLDRVDLTRINLGEQVTNGYGPRIIEWDALTGWETQLHAQRPNPEKPRAMVSGPHRRVDWVIVGGESGANARPMNPDWVRALRDQATQAGVPFFFKQWGEWWPTILDDEAEVAVLPNGRRKRVENEDGAALVRYHVWRRSMPPGSEMGVTSLSLRIGRRAAGRVLDGRTWDAMPERQEVLA